MPTSSSATSPRDPYEIVALASSAGGITALTAVLGVLPKDFPVPILVVQHLDPRHDTVLADVLSRRTRLGVTLASDHQEARPGVVYLAPPDHHLLVGAGGMLSLSSSELVHFVRPSADLLFESVAGAYGNRAIVCVLSGTGADGSMGVTAVHARGGTVIVEDPETAEFSGMPQAAIATGVSDFVLPVGEIGRVVRELVEPRSADAGGRA